MPRLIVREELVAFTIRVYFSPIKNTQQSVVAVECLQFQSPIGQLLLLSINFNAKAIIMPGAAYTRAASLGQVTVARTSPTRTCSLVDYHYFIMVRGWQCSGHISIIPRTLYSHKQWVSRIFKFYCL